MRKAKGNLFHLFLLIILSLIELRNCFQFKYIQVLFDPTIIEEMATYTFQLNRQTASDLSPTNWADEPIPTDFNVSITFPHQYEVSDLASFNCNYVLLDYNPVSNYVCTLDSATKTIVISGLFPAISNVSIIDVQLSNIRNPSPSIITDPFVGYIGTDYSSNDTRASVFFDPAPLNSFNITFSNPTVNTTSDMILSLQIKNYLPTGGHIELIFPPSLQWSRDLSINNLFPIDGILSCEGITPNTNTIITCLGRRSTRTVAFTNIANTQIGPNTKISFKLKNMFSPPTTQTTNPSDSLLVKTFDAESNQIQFKNSFVSGLVAKSFSSFQVLPLSGQTNFIVNTWTGLNFTFNLADTTNFEDYFHMIFPSSTSIFFNTSSSTFRFTSAVNYNTTNSTLTMFQSTNSQQRYGNNNVFIGFRSYLAPKSCRVQNIQFKIMRYGYEKMIGTAQIQAETNKYSMMGLGLNETRVNMNTSLVVSFQLKDSLSGTGMILLLMPEKIKMIMNDLSMELGSSLSSSGKVKQFPSLRHYSYQQVIPSTTNITSVTCTSIGGCLLLSDLIENSSVDIKSQNISLTIKGLKNIEYVSNIDVLGIRTFYDSEWDSRVAQISQNVSAITLRTTSGVMLINSIDWANGTVNYQSTQLTVSMSNQNPIPTNGSLFIYIPSQLYVQLSVSSSNELPTSLHVNSLTYINNQPLTINNGSCGMNITLNLNINMTKSYCMRIDLGNINWGTISSIQSNTNITLTFMLLSPSSKQPLSVMNWYVQSTTSSFDLIDQFSTTQNSNFLYRTMYENSLSNLNIYRNKLNTVNITSLPSIVQNDCQQNAETCSSYIFELQQQQPFQNYESASKNKNIIQIQIGKNIDTSIAKTAYLAVQSQIVFIDSSTLTLYSLNNNSTFQWIPIVYAIQQLDNRTNILSFQLPQALSLNKVSSLKSTIYNRLSLPFPLNIQSTYSHFFISLQNVKNPFSLSPFTLTYRTTKSIQNLNSYTYSSGTSDILKNSDLLSLNVTDFNFTSRLYQSQSNLNINISLNNWNELSSTQSIRSSSRNNVRYIILTMGKGFTFSNISSVGLCQINVNNNSQNLTCSIQEISANFTWTQKINITGSTDIVDMLSNSQYLVVLTVTDSFSSLLQNSNPNDTLTLSMGQFMNPSISVQSLSLYAKSVSMFTLSQMQYLIHKSLLGVVFSTNCLSPCKQCIFTGNSSSQVSKTCSKCSENMWLYNGTCLEKCPQKTFQSSKIDSDNVTTIKICVDCLPQCGSCMDNTQCTGCDVAGAFKYEFIDLSNNKTNCVSQCPIDGYYQNSITINTTTTNTTVNDTSTTNSTTLYECATCKTNCSMCTNDNDCYKCTGFLILSKNICIETCPSDTIFLVKSIVFKNTTVENVSVCQQCSVYLNDSQCQYCSLSACLACKGNYSLDYLVTKKCVSTCPDGYYSTDKILNSYNYTYSTCEKCNQECGRCETSSNNCLTCKWIQNNTVGQFYQLNNSCYLQSTCPIGFYPNKTTKTCSDCSIAISGCVSCSSSINCTQCDLGLGYYNFTSTNNNTKTSICLKSNQIPKGYLLINNTIQKCAQYCTDCSLSTDNCTDCIEGYYVFNLQTGIGQCVSQCPSKYYPANYKLCTVCPSPCQTCTLDSSNISSVLCTSCLPASSLYYYNNNCINSTDCPNTTYPYRDSLTSHKQCKKCLNNCYQCQDDGTTCFSCQLPNYFSNNTCISKQLCPTGTVAMINSTNNLTQCSPCTNNCLTCINTPNTCTSCITLFYLIPSNNTCVQSCPSPLIQNTQNMSCVNCISPCSTCSIKVNNCTSCIDNFYKYQNTCVQQNKCPNGYYANRTTKNCQICPSQCTDCLYNQLQANINCSKCKTSFALFEGKCLNSCPQIKQFNISGVCLNCSQAIEGCFSCSISLTQNDSETNKLSESNKYSDPKLAQLSLSDIKCRACYYPYILFNSTCIMQCPPSYIYKKQTHQCLTPQQDADQILSQSLSNSTIMPLPFSIICAGVFIACILSKLQNENTYLVGTIYSLVGIVETVSLGYLILRIITKDELKNILNDSYNTILMLFYISLGLIYVTNLIAAIVQTYLLSGDQKFAKYSSKHFIAYMSVSFISFLTSYKFKLIMASRLFDFACFKCQLQSIQKFNIFNLFSFLGIGHQGLLLYVTCLILVKFRNQIGNELFLTILDVALVAGINAILALAVSKKDEDFFQQKYQGLVINKKIDAGSQQQTIDYNKLNDTAKTSFTQNVSSNKKNNDTSNQKLMQQISEDDQFSLSISHDNDTYENKSKNIFDRQQQSEKGSNKSKQNQEEQEAPRSSTQLKMQSVQDKMKQLSQKNKSNNKLNEYAKSFKSLEHLKSLNNLDQLQKINKSQMFSPSKRYQLTNNQDQELQNQLKKKNQSLTPHRYQMLDIRETAQKAQRSQDKIQQNNLFQGDQNQQDLVHQGMYDKGIKNFEDNLNQNTANDDFKENKEEFLNENRMKSQLDRLQQSEEKNIADQYNVGQGQRWELQEDLGEQNIQFERQKSSKLFFQSENDDLKPNQEKNQVQALGKNMNQNSNNNQVYKKNGHQDNKQELNQSGTKDNQNDFQDINLVDNIAKTDINHNQQPSHHNQSNIVHQTVQGIDQNVQGIDRQQKQRVVNFNDEQPDTRVVQVNSNLKQNIKNKQSQDHNDFNQFKQSSHNEINNNQINHNDSNSKYNPNHKQLDNQYQNQSKQSQSHQKNDQHQSKQQGPQKMDKKGVNEQLRKSLMEPKLETSNLIKSNQMANNFFNQPLEEQQMINNQSSLKQPTTKNSSLLIQQKEKQLQMLRKSREDLQQQNEKLKNRSRSRSKDNHRQKSIKEQIMSRRSRNLNTSTGMSKINLNQLQNKGQSRYNKMDQQQQRQNKMVKQQQKYKKMDHQMDKKMEQVRRQDMGSQLSNRLTAREILNLPSDRQSPLMRGKQINDQKDNQPYERIENTFNKQGIKNNNLYEEINNQQQQVEQIELKDYEGEKEKQQEKRQSTINDRTISNNNRVSKQLKEGEKRTIDELTTARYQTNKQRRLSQQNIQRQAQVNSYIDTLHINYNQIDQDTAEQKLINKKHSSKSILNNRNKQHQQLNRQTGFKRIDLGQFANDNQHQANQDDFYQQNLTRSREKRNLIYSNQQNNTTNNTTHDNNYNQKHTNEELRKSKNNNIDRNINMTPPPKQSQVYSLDRIAVNKIHPPTSRPPKIHSKNNTSQNNDISFTSGKTNQSHYPLYSKSKQLQMERQSSQAEVSFYHVGQNNNNFTDNSFQDIHAQYYSNEISDYSSQPYAQGYSQNKNQFLYNQPLDFHLNNNQPSKPTTLPLPKFRSSKIQDSEELSKLINKNRNSLLSNQKMKRSTDKKSFQQSPYERKNSRNINTSQERNMSANIKNRSIQKNVHTSSKQLQEGDALSEYYNRGRRQNTRQSGRNIDLKLNRSRSKSKQRPLSKESQNKLSTLQKIYLQKLQWKK